MSDTAPQASAVDDAVLDDRRRSKRVDVAESLIPLLRNPAGDDAALNELYDQQYDDEGLWEDGGNGVRGVFFGMLLSMPLWVGIVEGVRLVCR